MAIRQRKPQPPCECGCAELARRLAEAEAVIAALARNAVVDGQVKDVRALPGNRTVDCRTDAAAIRSAAARREPAASLTG